MPAQKAPSGFFRFLWAGLAIVVGFPFFAAAVSAALLFDNRSWRVTVLIPIILYLSWRLADVAGVVIAIACAAALYTSAKTQSSFRRALLRCSGAAVLTGLLLSFFFSGYMNIGQTELEPLRDMYVSAGLEQDVIDRVLSLIEYYSPAIGTIHLVLSSAVSVFLFRSLLYNKHPGILSGSSDFKMFWGVAWLPIFSLLTVIYARSHPVSHLLLRIAGNTLLFSALPYAVEGFQVSRWWAREIPGMTVVMLLAAAFFTPFAAAALVLLGILDTWFDYRKMIQNRIERTNNEGSSDKNS